MFVRDIMTSPAHTVSADTTVKAALQLLDVLGVTVLPVVDKDNVLLGVVSEADLIRDAVPPDARSHILPVQATPQWHPHVVAEVMTREVVSVAPNADLSEAVEAMTWSRVKSLPVTTGIHVVGAVSRRDVVHLLARDDDLVKAELDELVRFSKHDWLVQVDDGIVTITGPSQQQTRQLASSLAYSVPGTLEVRFP